MTAEMPFQIFVTLPCDDVCTLRNVTGETLVYELKSRVEIKTGIPGDILQLFFMNRQLLDQANLSEYKLQNGCIVRMKLEQNWNDLFEACRRGDIYEVFENGVQFLDPKQFEGCNISLWNKLVIQRASLALFVACHRGYLGLILELLNHSAADINGKTVFGRTALHAAAYQGFVGCVSLLISEGALCNQLDYSGKTPLSLASENGHVYCEKRLLLYQWSLRNELQRTNSSGSSQGSQHSGNNLKPSADRERRHGTRKVPSNSPTNSTRDSESYVGRKELHFQLPRVGDAIVDSKHKTKNITSAQPNQTPFPLVHLAEKYHQEFQEYQKQNHNLPPRVVKEHHSPRPSPKHVDSADHLRDIKKAAQGAALADKLKIEPPHDGENLRKHQGHAPVLKEGDKNSGKEIDSNNNNNSSKCLKRTNGAKKGQAAVDVDGTRSIAENDKKSSPGKTNELRRLSLVMAQDLSRSADVRQDPVTMVAEYSGAKTYAFSIEASPINVDAPEDTYSRHRAAITFETWLEKKRARGKLTGRPGTAPALKMNRSFGKSIDPEYFKKWLNSKKGNRSRTHSESSSSTQKRAVISTGMTFERWLEIKRGKGIEGNFGHVAESSRDCSGGKPARVRIPSVGKSFEQWLREKKQEISGSRDNGQDDGKADKNASRSGKPFHVWLEEKERARKIDMIHKATIENEEERQREMKQFRRWINPHYRTFDEWLTLKNEELVLERIRIHNEPKERVVSVQEKEEDSRVVFDIWLTMKALQEYKEEEKKYKEMKAQWELKDKEREYRKRLQRWTT